MASTHKELRSAPIRMPTTSTLMDDEPNKAASESNIELSPEGKVLNFRKIRRSPLVLREVGANVVQGARRVGTGTVAVGAHAYSNVKRAGQVGAQTVLAAGSIGVTGVRKAADFGIQKIQKAPDLGVTLAATAAAVVPMRLTRLTGNLVKLVSLYLTICILHKLLVKCCSTQVVSCELRFNPSLHASQNLTILSHPVSEQNGSGTSA